MKKYKDLNLKKIREECGLDFAHYTYGRGQCSCCYGPLDMPSLYWREGKKPVKVHGETAFHYEIDGKKIPHGDLTYILFKNADNGSGRIKTKEEFVKDYTCIEYNFKDEEQKKKVCQMLLDQLDDDYCLYFPKNKHTCIVILLKDSNSTKEKKEQGALIYSFGETMV